MMGCVKLYSNTSTYMLQDNVPSLHSGGKYHLPSSLLHHISLKTERYEVLPNVDLATPT